MIHKGFNVVDSMKGLMEGVATNSFKHLIPRRMKTTFCEELYNLFLIIGVILKKQYGAWPTAMEYYCESCGINKIKI